MRVTNRDKGLLRLLAAARWLTTTQVARLCFPQTCKVVPQRRLRLLRRDKYVHSVQANCMAEALHALGPRGKEMLTRLGWEHTIRLERKPPKNLEHFLGINDIRIAVLTALDLTQSRNLRLDFFFACWELAARSWRYTLIPDAVCCLRDGSSKKTVIAFEYDRGEERPGYILRHKFRRYERGLEGFPVSRVVMVVDTPARQEQFRSLSARHLPASKLFRFVVLGDLLTSLSVGDLA